jgi:hypothetical protein
MRVRRLNIRTEKAYVDMMYTHVLNHGPGVRS